MTLLYKVYLLFVTGPVFSQGIEFQLVTDSNVWMLSVSTGWTSESEVSCAAACLKMASDCYSFTYSAISKRCTPGTWAVFSQMTRDLVTESLYSAAVCRSDLGLNLTIHVNGTICHWTSSRKDERNYTDAARACKDKGLQLITMKTVSKVYVFLDIAKVVKDSFWIGLNDVKKESEFRWEDDDTLASSDVLNVVFHPDEPQYFGDERCVEYRILKPPGNNAECKSLRRYTCELVPTR